MTAPEFTTRDGVTYLRLPEVVHLPSGAWRIDGNFYDDEAWDDMSADDVVFHAHLRRLAVLHARQAERTPTPEETTVTDTPASTEPQPVDANGDPIPTPPDRGPEPADAGQPASTGADPVALAAHIIRTLMPLRTSPDEIGKAVVDVLRAAGLLL